MESRTRILRSASTVSRSRASACLRLGLLAFALLFLGLTAAEPLMAQDRARLVNPREKEKEAEEEKEAEATPVVEVEQLAEEAEPEPAPEPAEAEPAQAQATATPAEPEPAPAAAEPAPTEPEPAAAPARSADRPRASDPAAVAGRTPADRSDVPRANVPTRRPDVVQERIVVTEVLLDVLVTDRQGNVVTGLTADDFVVMENGEPAEITDVTFYGTEEELRGSGIEGDTRTDRYFVLLFHDQRKIEPALTGGQIDAGRRAQEWVRNLLPNDQVAVLGYDARLKLYQDFTRDKELAAGAVEAAALGKKDLDLIKRRSDPVIDPNSPSLFVNLPTGKTLRRETRKLQEALGLVGRAAEPIVGRKNLLLFSVGFGDIDFGGFGEYTPDPRYYPDMEQSLNDGNVAVYAIDLLGSRRAGIAGSRIADSLSSIANDTGGHYYYVYNNPITPLRQVAEDNQGYYLLSYSSQYPTGEKGYREVEVDTKDPSLQVRARRGYRYGT